MLLSKSSMASLTATITRLIRERTSTLVGLDTEVAAGYARLLKLIHLDAPSDSKVGLKHLPKLSLVVFNLSKLRLVIDNRVAE